MIEAKTSISANELRVEVPGRLLVDQLNASFENGEFVAILGQNGAGKSLSLMTLAGLREADGGSIACGLGGHHLESVGDAHASETAAPAGDASPDPDRPGGPDPQAALAVRFAR